MFECQLLASMPTLGIAEEILFVRHEQEDCNGKPDPWVTPKLIKL